MCRILFPFVLFLATITAALAQTPDKGQIVAVAVGDTCAFSVNGAKKSTGSQLKLDVPPATYSVTCKFTKSGLTKTRSVIVKPGQSAMAMFKP